MRKDYYPIKGYEGYYIINKKGCVRSVDRTIIRKGNVNVNYKEKIIFPSIKKCSGREYLFIQLSKHNISKSYNIHTLMAMTFLGYEPKNNTKELIVDHINNISTDNRLKNLQLITQKENLTKDRIEPIKHTHIKKYLWSFAHYNNKTKKWFCRYPKIDGSYTTKTCKSQLHAYLFYKSLHYLK